MSATPCMANPRVWESVDYEDHLTARRGCAVCPRLDWCRDELKKARTLAMSGEKCGPQGTWAGVLIGSATGRERRRPAYGACRRRPAETA